MKKFLGLFIFILLQNEVSQAQDLRGFLRGCAWGTLAGATAGVASMAFADKPNSSWGNVAKGASLGLYAGIAYGVYNINQNESEVGSAEFSIFPTFRQGHLEGLQVTSTLLSF